MPVPDPKNPHVAFSWLWINGKPVTIEDATGKPKHLEHFSCDFLVETVGYFEYVLFDPNYDDIEDLITQSDGSCQFQFGYAFGGQRSPTYNGYVLSYLPEYLYNGTRIHLQGLMSPVKMLGNEETRSWIDKPPDQIVNEIAAKNGMKPVVDPCKKIESREDIEGTDFKHKKWRQAGTDWHMFDRLAKQAVRTSDGVGGYVLYADHAKNELHFHPPRYEAGPVRTFRWRKPDTEIIRFAPRFMGNMLAVLAIGSSVHAPTLDAETGLQTDPVPQSMNKGSGVGKVTDEAHKMTRKPQSDTPFKMGGRTLREFPDKEQAENEAKYWYYRNAWLAAFEASDMTIVGDPMIEPYAKYEVQMPKKDGSLHWTSGIYWSAGVSHLIEEGAYTTTLHYWRSEGKGGELASPKPT